MTQQDVPATTAGNAPPRPRYRGRHLPMVAVVIAAFIATALAYSGMVLFGLEVAHMAPLEAYALAGFLEVSLVAVALMARNAALEGRPYGVLLTLTWVLSGTSGVFAALHEVAVPTASTPYMVVFRFVPPLVAALMWHLALVGERHLVTGHTLDERRREHRVHQYVTALELWRDARLDSSGSRRGAHKVRAAHERQRAARDRALKLLTVEDFERRMQVWVERLEAAERHGNRLDSIGADSVKRGTARGAMPIQVPEAQVAFATATPSIAAAGREPSRRSEGESESFAETFSAALVAEPPAERTDAPDEGTDAPDEGTDAVERTDAVDGQSAVPSRAPQPAEPLPETGHTRRVEMFDLVGRPGAPATPDGPDWAPVRDEGPAEATRSASDERDADEDAVTDDAPTNERDRRIVELARQGWRQKEIAAEVSASRSTVSRVVRRYEDQKPDQATAERELEPTPA